MYGSSLHRHTTPSETFQEREVWNPDSGYLDSQESNTPPWRLPGGVYGQQANFYLDLDSHDFDGNCFVGGNGFMVCWKLIFDELELIQHSILYQQKI